MTSDSYHKDAYIAIGDRRLCVRLIGPFTNGFFLGYLANFEPCPFVEVLLAVSFAWGPVLLDVMQSLVLLLHVCPFDTGDRIVFQGVWALKGRRLEE